MPSSEQTTNLGLSRWRGSDVPTREDFVTDNDILDAEIGRLHATPFTIPVAAWVPSATREDYGYEAALSIPSLAASDLVRADFDLSSLKNAAKAGVAPVGDIEDDAGILYSRTQLTKSLSGIYTLHKGAASDGVGMLSTNISAERQSRFDLVFGNNSWDQIGQAIARNEVPPTWIIGSEKDITLLNGDVLTLQIYGISHDELEEGGRARFTLGLRELTSFIRQMNSTPTNAGSFVGSQLFGWLNGELWNLLPADLRAIIKPVRKRTSSGNLSSTIRTDTMSIFCFSEIEVTGAFNDVGNPSFPGEGGRYPIFVQGLTPLVKRLNNGAGDEVHWWFRSPSSVRNDVFVGVNRTISGASGFISSNAGTGVNFGICIDASPALEVVGDIMQANDVLMGVRA